MIHKILIQAKNVGGGRQRGGLKDEQYKTYEMRRLELQAHIILFHLVKNLLS